MAGRIPAVPGGEGLTPQRSSPEWLGTNVQVDDPFHGRSDTGGPRGEGLTPQRSPGTATLQSGWVQILRLTIPFMAGQIPAVPVLPQLFLPVFELATCE